MNQTRQEKMKTFLVGQINSFCKEHNNAVSNETKKKSQFNNRIVTRPNLRSVINPTDRSHRETSKGYENNDFQYLGEERFRRLLKIKFLDCILKETEDRIVPFLNDNISNKSNSLIPTSKRKRDIMSSFSEKQNKVFYEKAYRKIPTIDQALQLSIRRIAMRKASEINQTRLPRDLRSPSSTSNPHYNVNAILDQYYDRYRNDVTASTSQIKELFCGSSEYSPIPQNWSSIFSSLENHLHGVRKHILFIIETT